MVWVAFRQSKLTVDDSKSALAYFIFSRLTIGCISQRGPLKEDKDKGEGQKLQEVKGIGF